MVHSLACVAAACDAALSGHRELVLLVQENLIPLVVYGPAFALHHGGRRLLRVWLDVAAHAGVPIEDYTAPALFEALQRFGSVLVDRVVRAITLDSPLWVDVVYEAAREDARDVLELLYEKMPHVEAPLIVDIASQGGNVGLLRWLHARHFGGPPTIISFRLAASTGSMDAIQWLAAADYFRSFPEWKRIAQFQNTLVGAVKSNHLHIVQWLFENDGVDQWAGVGLKEALSQDHVEIADFLMAHWSASVVSVERIVQEADLTKLFATGDIAKLQWLHQHGLLVNALQRTYVEQAKTLGHVHVLAFLEANVPDAFSRVLAPFGGANSEGGSMEAAQWALARGLLAKSLACVYAAAKHGHIDFVRWYVDTMENESMLFFPNYTAVPTAAQHGYLDCVKFLVEKQWGEALPEALMAAAAHGHLEVFDWLLYRCEKPFSMALAFVEAVTGGHLELVEWMHAKRCPRTLTIVRAASGGHVAVVQWLLKHTVPTSNELDAAVREAVRAGHLRVVRTLPWSRNCDHEALVRDARERGHEHIAKWIETSRSDHTQL